DQIDAITVCLSGTKIHRRVCSYERIHLERELIPGLICKNDLIGFGDCKVGLGTSFFKQVCPISVCSDSCPPGFQKQKKEGKKFCCYDCLPCPKGKISNKTDLQAFSAPWVKVTNLRDEAAMATSREKVFSWALMLVVLLLLLPQISCAKSRTNCPLIEVPLVPHEWHKPGDLIIGGMASQIICFFPAVNFEQHPYVDLDIELATEYCGKWEGGCSRQHRMGSVEWMVSNGLQQWWTGSSERVAMNRRRQMAMGNGLWRTGHSGSEWAVAAENRPWQWQTGGGGEQAEAEEEEEEEEGRKEGGKR
ncbi:hypothetical protein L345_13994, partial [Ophiophagus hannah]